ncbi:DinB family protein [Halobacillus shinanisalinarum]|uniref:DinB family protein n=1 Tax=Halobacillus shinanisalinarum TaxID=2932258 RepID=A0ABY4H4M8_9BACI|nr:DinB family protein [Halobacillus shinanisalinarum]UOQ95378.1 DinB family protein [Halobacillus shinanisalinarum]
MSKSAQFIDYFLSHREITKELAAKIDPKHYTYKPTPTSMEAQKLVNHIIESTYTFVRLANKQDTEKLLDENDSTDLTEKVNTYTEATVKLLSALSDDDFEQVIDVSQILGKKVPASQLLNMAIDHEINHKGNLFVYLREMGHTNLPMYVKV